MVVTLQPIAIIGDRQTGKSTRLVQMACADPLGLVVTESEDHAQRLYGLAAKNGLNIMLPPSITLIATKFVGVANALRSHRHGFATLYIDEISVLSISQQYELFDAFRLAAFTMYVRSYAVETKDWTDVKWR